MRIYQQLYDIRLNVYVYIKKINFYINIYIYTKSHTRINSFHFIFDYASYAFYH